MRESNTKDNLRILENLMSTLSTHTHTPTHTHLTGIFGSKGNVRQIQGSNIYAPRASDRAKVGNKLKAGETFSRLA